MRILTILLLILGLTACGLYYRVPVRQGNVLNPEAVARLEPGMTKEQVRHIMGTSLVSGGFTANRWDYVFYYRDPRAHVRQSVIKLYFTNGRLSDIEGDQEYLRQDSSGHITTASNG
ncbi:MAG TPA: outer membrane protein assembly factor BamE [Salinisphaeraceae bacterium]|nr:outer membrane protein assembly factor BamE [Salinisphaeraceae bacterium]